MVVTLLKVRKTFGPVAVVKDVTLAVEPGELMVLLGPSGSGKTTILRMIAGLEDVTSGRIEIDGRDVTHMLPKQRDVAMVFQSYALYPHMTVAGNIGYPLKLRGVGRGERDGLVREAAARVHLERFLDRYPNALSGGQRQRVAFARAIVRRPKVFLLDEPLSSLDPTLRGELRAEMKRLQSDLGVTTLYVTHDQIEAMTLARRIAILDDGVVAQLGSPRAIYDEPDNLFVARFIGSPAMNLIAGTVANRIFEHARGRVPLGDGARSGAAVIGIRPEACGIARPGAGSLAAEVFTTELMGDHTLVTASLGPENFVIKAARDFEAPAGTPIGIAFPSAAVSLFDPVSGARLRKPTNSAKIAP